MEKMNRSAGPAQIIVSLYNRRGYVRTPNRTRLKKEDRQKYKMGYEVRFFVHSDDELIMLQGALKKLNIKYGKPFRKHTGTILPVYGKDNYRTIMEMVENSEISKRN